MDLTDFLRQYARDYTDVDELYSKAKELDLVSSRREFSDLMMGVFCDEEAVKHIYVELPFKRHWTKIETPAGKPVGLIKWTDNPKFVGK